MLSTIPPIFHHLDCRDKRSNCADYGQNVCKEPYYKWGLEYCPKYCGHCNGKTSPFVHITNVLNILTPIFGNAQPKIM